MERDKRLECINQKVDKVIDYADLGCFKYALCLDFFLLTAGEILSHCLRENSFP